MAYPGQPQALYELSQILIEDQEARRSFEDHLRESQWGVRIIRKNNGMYSGPWRTSPLEILCVLTLLGVPLEISRVLTLLGVLTFRQP